MIVVKGDPGLVDDPHGALPQPKGTGFDAREHALRALRRFMAALLFERRMPAPRPTERFAVPIQQIHVYQPDDVLDIIFPAIGIRPGRGRHEAIQLGPPELLEDTRDLYGEGTVLLLRSEYTEQFGLEALATKHPHRVAIVAGLQEALTTWQSSAGLRLRIPDYYDQIASFRLDESEYIDDDPVFRNRRRADLYVTLRVPEVSLVRYVEFQPEVIRIVDSGNKLGLDALQIDDWP